MSYASTQKPLGWSTRKKATSEQFLLGTRILHGEIVIIEQFSHRVCFGFALPYYVIGLKILAPLSGLPHFPALYVSYMDQF